MAKVCTDNQGLPRPCLIFKGGQCEGDFYSLQFDVVVIRNFGEVDFSKVPPVFVDNFVEQTQRRDASQYFRGASNVPNQIKGKITCVSEPYESEAGAFVDIYFVIGGVFFSGYCRLQGAGRLVSGELVEVINLSTFPNADNCGDFTPNNVSCRCTKGDDTISCSSAQGGICCIKKSQLDAICDALK